MRGGGIAPPLIGIAYRSVSSAKGGKRSLESKKMEAKNKKAAQGGFLLNFLGWLMGLEPTTTGITILDSTN
jgi:hypothetical protein